MTTPTDQELEKVARAAEEMDWQQVVLNGGPPCFHLEGGRRFCGRAQEWIGHEHSHKFISLFDLLSALKQVQPTKPLVDSIAVSPQEQQGEEIGNAALEIFHVFYPHSPKSGFHPKERNRINNIIVRTLGEISGLAAKAEAMRDVPNEYERNLYEAIYRLRVPPPASTPANPPKEGRASAKSETTEGKTRCATGDNCWIAPDGKHHHIPPCPCVPNIDTQREEKKD